MSTTVSITLDTKNVYAVQAFVSAMGSFLMNQSFDHSIKMETPAE